MKLKNTIKKLTKIQKIVCLILILIFFLLITVSIPSLAKFKNRSTILNQESWDGSIASSYSKGNGTKENPYIISNGSELAFFSKQLETTNYENTYFKLNSDIILNDGVFNYDTINGITYTKENTMYYVDEYTNNYYANIDREGSVIGTLNQSSPLSNFKGEFDGNSFIIYGLYITSSDLQNLGFFASLEGNLSNLYIENSVIYGGVITGGIASTSNNATIKNTIYDGYVISSDAPFNSILGMDDFSINIEESTIINKEFPLLNLEGKIESITLSGEYLCDNSNAIIKINGTILEAPNFEIDLGQDLLYSVDVSILADIPTNISFSNLAYKVVYKKSIASGLIGEASSTTIINSINKSNVYGNYISSGFVGKLDSSIEITNAYNNGDIKGEYIASGFIGCINNNSQDVNLSKIYNSGNVTSLISSAFISHLNSNTGSVNISSSFNTSDNYSINTSLNTTINITNSYNINNLDINEGELSGEFVQTDISSFYNKTFMKNTMKYLEFDNYNDISNKIWIYENNSIPILFIDDINNPVASLNLNIYSFNNFTTDLSILMVNKTVTFSIDYVGSINKIKEKYYYISESTTSLTENTLKTVNWIPYADIVQINKTGYYVVYAKILDNDGNITYINTDILAVDLDGLDIKIKQGKKVWDKNNKFIEEIYINEPSEIAITANDSLLDITSIEYYVSKEILNKSDLNNVSWVVYSTPVFPNLQKYIVYVKVKDSAGNTTYANSDFIIYGGYIETLKVGQNNSNYNTNYISNDSSFILDFRTNVKFDFKKGYEHVLTTNYLLPVGTKLTLMIDNRVYSYKITSSDDLYNYNNSCEEDNCIKLATYNFNLFKEIGTIHNNYFNDSIYEDSILENQNIKILINLPSFNNDINYNNFKAYLEIRDDSNNSVFSTLTNSITSIDILDGHANPYVNTDYSGDNIQYNSNSSVNINLTSGIEYATMGDKLIIDTTYENKKVGLAIMVYDSFGNIVSKDNLKNLSVILNSNTYYIGNDNIIRINLNNGLDLTSSTLTINTSYNDSLLKEGIYYIRIYSFATYDGNNFERLSDNYASIPIYVNSNINNMNYDFSIDAENVIVNKSINNQQVKFTINTANIISPKVRISLYEKSSLSAYNQTYAIVDFANYVNNQLESSENNTYLINDKIVTFDLKTDKFSNKGYKYVFELYDGNKKIGQTEKYFYAKK